MRDIASIRAQNIKASEITPIQGRRLAGKPFVIVSAFLADNDHLENLGKLEELRGALRALPHAFKQVHGSYQGTREDSFMVVLDDLAEVDQLLRLAGVYDQETILVVNDGGDAMLQWVATGEVEYLGRWRQVHLAQLDLNADDYTCDYDGHYYAVTRAAREEEMEEAARLAASA